MPVDAIKSLCIDNFFFIVVSVRLTHFVLKIPLYQGGFVLLNLICFYCLFIFLCGILSSPFFVQGLRQRSCDQGPTRHWKSSNLFNSDLVLCLNTEVMSEYGFSVDDLTPNAIHTIVGFELVCQALGVLPQLRAFQFFFSPSTHSGVHTFSQRRKTHMFIVNHMAP